MTTCADIIAGPIADVASKYEVRLIPESGPESNRLRRLSGWKVGPQLEALNIRLRAVSYSFNSSPEGVLHELVHVVLGPDSLRSDGCESYILFPFEWSLVRYVANVVKRELPDCTCDFVEQCRRYQDDTTIISVDTSLADFGGRTGLLWKESRRLAVLAGLITATGRPTFRGPDWSKVPSREPSSWRKKWLNRKRGLWNADGWITLA